MAATVWVTVGRSSVTAGGRGPHGGVDALVHRRFDDADNLVRDLSLREAAAEVMPGAREVYSLAADMGGMGFIAYHKVECMLSVLVTSQVAARLSAAHA